MTVIPSISPSVQRLAAMAAHDDGDVMSELRAALRDVAAIDDVEEVAAAAPARRVGADVVVSRTTTADGRVRLCVSLPESAGVPATLALEAAALDHEEAEAAAALVTVAMAARAARHARAAARIDPLTGVLNHGAMRAAVAEELARAARTGTPLSCLMIDVDHFKEVNDRHGHAVGDRVLRRVAEGLTERSRPYDRVCRYGGDEFTVLMPGVGLAEAAAAAERIRVAMSRALAEVPGLDVPVVASVGVAEAQPQDGPDDLLEAADRALLEAKRSGRDGVRRATGRFRRT